MQCAKIANDIPLIMHRFMSATSQPYINKTVLTLSIHNWNYIIITLYHRSIQFSKKK